MQTLRGAPLGVMLTDADARPVFINPSAEMDLAAGRLCSVNGRLAAADPDSTAKLQSAIGAAAKRTGAVAATVLAPEAEAGVFSIAVAPFLERPPSRPDSPLALLIMERPRSFARSELQSAYGLTSSEASLLSALVQGERLSDYARRRGVRLSTVKTHLRNLFLKTGEQRQVDLIRRVLSDRRRTSPPS